MDTQPNNPAGPQLNTGDVELPPDQSQRIVASKELGTFLLLSVSDEPIELGKGSPPYDDFSPYSSVHIFSETIAFTGDLLSPNGLSISCNKITIVNGPVKINTTGVVGADQVIGGDVANAGGNGGSINFYSQGGSDDVEKRLSFVANGGSGGDVVVKDAQAGNGGDGGHCVRIFQSRYSAILDSIHGFLDRFEDSIEVPLDSLVRPKDSVYGEASKLLTAILKLDLTAKELVEKTQALRDKLSSIKSATNCKVNDIVICVRFIRNRLKDLADQQKDDFVPAVDYTGGYPGSGNGVRGNNGVHGKDGSDEPLFLSTYDPVVIRKTSFAFAHPDQCAMLLDRAKTFYYMGSPQLRLQAEILFQRLVRRLNFLPLENTDPLYKAYTSNDLLKLKAIQTDAANWLTQLATGVGFNGHTDNWTPRASYTFYEGMLDTAIADFTAFENAYIQYHLALSKKQNLKDSINLALRHTSQMTTSLNKDIEDLTKRLHETENCISSLTEPVAVTHAALKITFETLEARIKNNFELSVPQIINALRGLAFSPTKGMAGVEGANLLYEGVTSVPDIEGRPVNKDFIIRKIQHGKATVKNIKDTLDKKLDGEFKLDDPLGTRLMTAEEDMMSFLEAYANSCFADVIDEMKGKFDAFVKAIIARNEQVVLYNIQLKLYVSKISERANNEQKATDLKGKNIEANNPNLPIITAYMGDIYQSARARVMQLLDNLVRSLNYRGLTRYDIFDLAFRGTESDKVPLTITSNVLLGARSRIQNEFGKVVEKWGSPPVRFPQNFDNDQGKCIQLKKGDREALVGDRKVTVEIPVVKKDTITKGPFSGCSNVRVYRVRFHLTGLIAKERAFVSIRLKHSGEEVIVDFKNSGHKYVHEPVTTRYSFYLDPDGTTVVEDNGNFSGVDVDETVKYYAAPGPFTKWEVDLAASQLNRLDFSKVTEAYFDFCGTNYAFP